MAMARSDSRGTKAIANLPRITERSAQADHSLPGPVWMPRLGAVGSQRQFERRRIRYARLQLCPMTMPIVLRQSRLDAAQLAFGARGAPESFVGSGGRRDLSCATTRGWSTLTGTPARAIWFRDGTN